MIFVTGATGMLGGYLLLELSRRGNSIRALKRKSSSLDAVKNLFLEFSDLESFEKIEWIDGDILDIISLEKALEGVETVYHTAAMVSFDDRKRKTIQSVNVEGTQNLVNVSLAFGVKNFIYVSSIAVLDKVPGEDEINEKSKWDPELSHSEYAISKKKAEMAVWRGSQEGLNVIITYPSIIIGSFDGRRESEKIFYLSNKEKTFSTEGATGYVDVRDVSYILAELADKKMLGQSYILSAGEWSYSEVIDFIRNRWNKKPSKVFSKKRLKFIQRLSLLSRIFGGRYLSSASYHGLTDKVKYSNQKIKEILNFDFIPVEDALIFHSDRYKKNLK